jgi:hypothetical protein
MFQSRKKNDNICVHWTFFIAKIVLKNETKIQKLSDIGGLLSLEVGKTIVIRILVQP